MQYDLVLDDYVDVALDRQATYNMSFKPRNSTTLHIGSETECLSMMTLAHLQKIIASDIKFFHKKNMEFGNIDIYYQGYKLPTGKVIDNMCFIESLPKS